MSIKVENLTHIYNKGLAYETRAVDDISFEIADNEFIGIIGHTGSGKSTLVQHLNGILKPESGKITIGDTVITDKNVNKIDIRRKIGLVFQYPEYQLFEETVREDVAFGPRNLGLEEEEINYRVIEALELVGLDYGEIADRSPFDLSGGQKRRVAIAGVIAMKPEVLMLDEPTAGLDPKAHKEILEMIKSVKEQTKSIVILVSHKMDDIAELADRIFILDKGKIVKQGTPQQVFLEGMDIRKIGLGVPQATELAKMFEKKGLTLDDKILNISQLEESLVSKLISKRQDK